MSPLQLKFSLHLYQARIHLLNRNIKSAKKEIRPALQLCHQESEAAEKLKKEKKNSDLPADSPNRNYNTLDEGRLTPAHNSAALLLKSNLEYLRGKYQKAIKFLNSSCNMQGNKLNRPTDSKVNEDGKSRPHLGEMCPPLSLYYNNYGCIDIQQKQFYFAGHHFNKALSENQQLCKLVKSKQTNDHHSIGSAKSRSAPKGSIAFRKDRRAEILYNSGVRLFLMRKLELACACFYEAVQLINNRPSIWLRMAECCVALHLQKRRKAKEKYENELQRHRLQSTSNRRILLPSSSAALSALERVENSRKKEQKKQKNKSGFMKPSYTSLPYVIKYLRNALHLLSISPETQNKEKLKQRSHLYQLCLLNMMYVSLCLNNPILTVTNAKKLLQIKDLKPFHKYLACNYASEAFCLLNKPDKTFSYLDPQQFNDKSFENAYCHENGIHSPHMYNTTHKGSTGSANYYRCALYVNLAVAHIAQNNLDKAWACLKQGLGLENLKNFPPALRTQVYINLRQGDTAAALKILKKGKSFQRISDHKANTVMVVPTANNRNQKQK